MPKISDLIKQKAIQLRQEGKSLSEIAELVDIHPGTVKKWCRKVGIKLTHEQFVNTCKHYTSEQDAKIKELFASGLSRQKIAESIDIPAYYIQKVLNQGKPQLSGLISDLNQIAIGKGFHVVRNPEGFKGNVELLCPNKHVLDIKARSFLNSGGKCIKCHYESRKGKLAPYKSKYKWKDVQTILKQLQFKCSEIEVLNPNDLVSKTKSNWDVICRCGGNINSRLTDIILGKVTSCGCIKSKPEVDLRSFFELFNLKADKYRYINDHGETREFDLLINEKKLAIEYNGLAFHSQTALEKRTKSFANYHKEKTLDAEKQGLRLIHIFEDEWIYRQYAVLGYLNAILGNTIKIHGRKCVAKPIKAKVARLFMDKYHIQGSVLGNYLGMFYDGKLVSVLSYIKTILNGKTGWHISRFCNKSPYTVVGGFSKMISKLPPADFLLTYSDNRWTEGNLYQKTGFVLFNESVPSYYYFKKGTQGPLIHKMRFRKAKIKKLWPQADLNKTEWELMQEFGYDRIYDCGKKTWIKWL